MMISLRICCVLIFVTFHVGVILLTILTFSVAQFLIELQNLPKPPNFHPLPLSQGQQPFRPIKTRLRSKSKPDEIFIHPAESNIARADAAAIELGLGGDTERVRGQPYKDESAWQAGTGRERVRTMLAGQLNVSQPSIASEREPFLIGETGEESE